MPAPIRGGGGVAGPWATERGAVTSGDLAGHDANVLLLAGICGPGLGNWGRVAHMGTLMPCLTSQAFAGQEVQYPMIMPICMRNQ